jgi:hypothetical protein
MSYARGEQLANVLPLLPGGSAHLFTGRGHNAARRSLANSVSA